MEHIVGFQYSVTVLICIFLMIHYYRTIQDYSSNSDAVFCIKLSILFAIMFAVADVFFGLREYGIIEIPEGLRFFTEIIYSVGSIASAYFWFLCSEKEQNSKLVNSKSILIACTALFLVIVLMFSTTWFHHLAFYFEDDHYIRGSLNNISAVIILVFILKSGITAVIQSFKKEYYTKRVLLRSLAVFSLMIVAVQLIQLFLGWIMPFRVMGVTAVFYIIQNNLLRNGVFLDRMTGLNNRQALEHYLANHFENAGEDFFFMMLDLDYFKQINDRFGHVEGDKAIRLAGNAIVRSIPGRFCVARYGGDEFSIAGTEGDAMVLAEMITKIRQELKESAEKEKLSYTIDISAGYAYKSAEIQSIPEIISAADKKMYLNKRERKAKNK